jgi:hypothetical protein
MPELTVALPFWIVSQVFSFAAIVLVMVSYQIKHKPKMLAVIGGANLTIALSAALLLNWVVVILMMSAGVRNFVFAYLGNRDSKGQKTATWIPFVLMIVFMISIVVPTWFTWDWWLDWILVLTSLFIIYGAYAKGIHKIRIAFLGYYAFVIVNFILFLDVIGIVRSALGLGSVIVFYVRFAVTSRRGNFSPAVNDNLSEHIERNDCGSQNYDEKKV